MFVAMCLRKFVICPMSAATPGEQTYFARNYCTGFACHLPPPSSNHERCPPRDVEQRTVYGFCFISSFGTPSSTAIYPTR